MRNFGERESDTPHYTTDRGLRQRRRRRRKHHFPSSSGFSWSVGWRNDRPTKPREGGREKERGDFPSANFHRSLLPLPPAFVRHFHFLHLPLPSSPSLPTSAAIIFPPFLLLFLAPWDFLPFPFPLHTALPSFLPPSLPYFPSAALVAATSSIGSHGG